MLQPVALLLQILLGDFMAMRLPFANFVASAVAVT